MKQLAILAAAFLLAACSSVKAENATRTGTPPVCSRSADIGPLIVVPQTRWRPDQKEPDEREAIAVAAITAAFSTVPCAREVRVLPIRPASGPPESIPTFEAGDARTALVLTVKELGPIFIISVPVLWSGWSDVVFDVQVVDLPGRTMRLDLTHHRKVGGPWTIRGVGPLQKEFETALKSVLTGD